MSDDAPLKRCTKCGKYFAATTEFFYRDATRPGGLYPACKQCKKAYADDYRVTHREKLRVASRIDYYKHREKRLEYNRHWNREHREHVLNQKRQYRSLNKDRLNAEHQRRRAKRLMAHGKYTAADIRLQYKTQKGRCWWCSKQLGNNYEVDHRIPITRGGSNAPENLCISCPACNRSKSNKLPWEWKDRLL
jgi:5-methylcytosine-specific restriction endonuclease McrA